MEFFVLLIFIIAGVGLLSVLISFVIATIGIALQSNKHGKTIQKVLEKQVDNNASAYEVNLDKNGYVIRSKDGKQGTNDVDIEALASALHQKSGNQSDGREMLLEEISQLKELVKELQKQSRPSGRNRK